MSNKRNLGVDLLRIVCNIMIVTLHVLLQGGVLIYPKSFQLSMR